MNNLSMALKNLKKIFHFMPLNCNDTIHFGHCMHVYRSYFP